MTGKILLADDEVTFRETFHAVLTEEGNSVTAVSDGLHAMEAFEKESFDVALLDIQMPGADGIKVLREIMKTHPETRGAARGLITFERSEFRFRGVRTIQTTRRWAAKTELCTSEPQYLISPCGRCHEQTPVQNREPERGSCECAAAARGNPPSVALGARPDTARRCGRGSGLGDGS